MATSGDVPTTMSRDVVTERRDAALWIRLNRSDALNAITPGVVDGLRAALDAAASDAAVRVLVVTGNGRAFCAGADLKEVRRADGGRDAFAAFLRSVGRAFDELEACPKPVIGAVNGLALAGGLELLCCDLVIAAASAKLGDAHANYGLLPGAGASVRLPRRIGIARAKQLFFTGAMVPAAELVAAGLVNEVVADEDLDGAVGERVSAIAAKSPLGLSRMKRLANDAWETPAPIALRAELAAGELHRASHDMNEGLAAFAEKRPPRFEGR